MILASRLNGFCPVELFQNHNPRQMVGEGHRSHGKTEIRLCLTRGDIPKEEPIKKQALDLPEFFTSRSLSAKLRWIALFLRG